MKIVKRTIYNKDGSIAYKYAKMIMYTAEEGELWKNGQPLRCIDGKWTIVGPPTRADRQDMIPPELRK